MTFTSEHYRDKSRDLAKKIATVLRVNERILKSVIINGSETVLEVVLMDQMMTRTRVTTLCEALAVLPSPPSSS